MLVVPRTTTRQLSKPKTSNAMPFLYLFVSLGVSQGLLLFHWVTEAKQENLQQDMATCEIKLERAWLSIEKTLKDQILLDSLMVRSSDLWRLKKWIEVLYLYIILLYGVVTRQCPQTSKSQSWGTSWLVALEAKRQLQRIAICMTQNWKAVKKMQSFWFMKIE